MGIFRFRIVRLLFYIVCFSISISAMGHNDIYSVDSYKNILDIRYTPYSNDYFTGGFSDSGAWVCFTLPSEDNWVNGFCGPFELDHRLWISDALLQVGFTPNVKTEMFKPVEVSYAPGELYMSSSSDMGNIQQRLFFVDRYTALWSCEAAMRNLYVLNGSLSGIKQVQLTDHVLSMTLFTGELCTVTFSSDFKLSYENSKFQAVLPKGMKGYAAISYFYESQRPEGYTAFLQNMIERPDACIANHKDRWFRYLKSVLRPEMPIEYHRIAVKAMVTLLSNWRASRGDLLHDGVIPSHAMSYFIGFWGWDSWKHAVALSWFEPELAKNQVRAMFDYQTPEGMIIDCIYIDKNENNERNSKPPLAAWAVSEIYKSTQDADFVKEIYPKLLHYHQWWYKYRDHDRNGYCEFGAVDGTLEAAAWESGMDNAIRFDRSSMVSNGVGAWSLNQESVDLNAYLAYEYRLLKELAIIAGYEFVEPDRTASVADYFFDAEKGFFYDRKLKGGDFVKVEGCEAYIPFWTQIATPEQAKAVLPYFTDPLKFSTYIPFPTVTADHPQFSPNGYWRGPIWLDQVYFGIRGLRNYGYAQLADDYTKRVFDRLNGLRGDAPIHENYETNTGKRLKSPHFSWSAAHLLMLYREAGVLDAKSTDLCLFQSDYRNYAYIQEVEFENIHHKMSYSETGWTDYSSEYTAEVENGKTYQLKATVVNWDSGDSDTYKLRLWIDWNRNYELEETELNDTKLISPIGERGKEHICRFSVTIPESLVKGEKLKFRLFLHFVTDEADGTDPCGWVDSGIACDYGLVATQSSGFISSEEGVGTAKVYPNPVADNLYIESATSISRCFIYDMEGCERFGHSGNISKIDVTPLPPGNYILRIVYDEKAKRRDDFFKVVVQ